MKAKFTTSQALFIKNKTKPVNDRTWKRKASVIPFSCSVLPVHEVYSPDESQCNLEKKNRLV